MAAFSVYLLKREDLRGTLKIRLHSSFRNLEKFIIWNNMADAMIQMIQSKR